MKLAYSPASPYVRKVTACAIKRGIDKQIERMKISTTDPELLKYNALSKVPTLITDDGAYLFDSPVICEYLRFDRYGAKTLPSAGSGALEGADAGGAGRRHPRCDAAPPARAHPAAGRGPQELHCAPAG